MAAGIVVWIQTDTGHLVIEADEAAFVRVVKGDDVVKSWKIIPGRNETTIRAGRYSIELDGQFDSLDVDGGEFKLTRGDRVIATVKRSAPPADVADNGQQVERPSGQRPSDKPDETGSRDDYDFGGLDTTPREYYQTQAGKLMSLHTTLDKCAKFFGTANSLVANVKISAMQQDLAGYEAKRRKVSQELRAKPLSRTEESKQLKVEKSQLEQGIALTKQQIAELGRAAVALERLERDIEPVRVKLNEFRNVFGAARYEGKTWDEWRQQAERSTQRPERLGALNNSLKGMNQAAGGTRHSETADFILKCLEFIVQSGVSENALQGVHRPMLPIHLTDLGPYTK